ncbi:adenylate kinase family protein [Leptothoe sp. PORK10 BA2]|uniref:adenylate kinase family protein n=1 Tax=Leptothoe sp. PORK10 BA2 TaxID=3110254 RepID=UPI002B1F160E|nr:nucleoside monophosphate kinase [Leptothoe sp. PORK10 BA2]MEA5463094.1 nucleoside monophosphate kinase [Leptothoe sp. PORK10 BA2]
MQLVVLGGPGSGKGTQAKKLSDHFGIPWISTGDALRAEIAADSTLGQQVSETLVRGELVSDNVMIDLIKVRLQQPDVAQGWILDGYPRTAFQAEELDFFLDTLTLQVNYVIWLELPAHCLIERSENRGAIDDNPEALRRRIETLAAITLPMLEYYDYRQRLLRVDGNQSPDDVKRDILAGIS